MTTDETTAPTAPTGPTLAQTLRAAGLRVTEQRLAVLAALDEPGAAHLTADQVHALVVRRLPGTPLQSVYLVLGALTGVGLLRRIEPAGSAARYERRTGDNHHHVVCSVCGAIADVDCAVGHAPCLTPSSAAGFSISTAEVTYWGLCASCTAAEAPEPH
jgi:Fur family transcriptional regulator, stress-responsive regulator